jgi:hypothetical protein
MRTRIQSENPTGRDHLRDLGIEGRILLNWSVWTGFSWLRLESSG